MKRKTRASDAIERSAGRWRRRVAPDGKPLMYATWGGVRLAFIARGRGGGPAGPGPPAADGDAAPGLRLSPPRRNRVVVAARRGGADQPAAGAGLSVRWALNCRPVMPSLAGLMRYRNGLTTSSGCASVRGSSPG